MISHPVDAVVFDLDGTLVDTAPTLHLATNHALSLIDRPQVDLQDIKHTISFGARAMIQKGLDLTGGANDVNIGSLYRSFLEYYSKNIAVGSHLFDGAEILLADLNNNNVSLFVCTNKSVELATSLINSIGLSKYFSGITGGNSFTFRKPDPRHIEHTLLIGGHYNNPVMIGDSAADINAAHACQIPSIAVTFGYSETPVTELNATHTVDHFSEIRPLLLP